MKYIDKRTGEIFFEELHEIITSENLTPKERIPKYRTLLEDLFKALTKEVRQHFGGLFAKMVFVCKTYQVDPKVISLVHGLRIYGNNTIHNSKATPKKEDDLRSIYQIAESIGWFSQLEVPQSIKVHYQHLTGQFDLQLKRKPPKLNQHNLYAVIEDIYIPPDHEGKGYLVLICNTEDGNSIKLKLWDNRNENGFGSNLTPFGKLAEPFQTIYITAVTQHAVRKEEFSATDQSLIVLEPDYLIQAKALSDCRQRNGDNPLLYLLNRFNQGELTDRIMVGNIVGKMLDDLITMENYTYSKSFEYIMRHNSFGMLCLANSNGSYDNITIEKVFREAKNHETALSDTLKEFSGKDLTLEPTFISAKYGLEGRLDLLVEDNSNRKDIVELKSSKSVPPLKFSLWKNHEAQTMVYDLLLNSTFIDRIGFSYILYSNASIQEKPLRNVVKENYLSMQSLLMLRNSIVASEYRMAKGDFQSLEDLLAEDFSQHPTFIADQAEDFITVYNATPTILKNYFLGYMQFIYRELQVAKVGSNDSHFNTNGFADLWKLSKTEKIDNYNVLVYLKIIDITEDFQIRLTTKKDLFSANISTFRVGDYAIFYPTPDPEELNPLNSQILKCKILSIEEDNLTISLINKQVDKKYFNRDCFWAIDKDFRESGYKRMLQLNFQLLESKSDTIDLVLGLERPTFDPISTFPNEGLNEGQYEMVQRAIAAKNYFLIQGPPGTGKTSKVLCHTVKQASNGRKSIMVLAFTNRAVDEIGTRLHELGVEFIRLGKGSKLNQWSTFSDTLSLDKLFDKVQETKVFLSTQATFSANLDLLKFKNFDTLIVDEASQLLEPHLVGLLQYFNKWILIGDENQLPAVVLQSEIDSKCHYADLNQIGLTNYRESLFYRLKKNAKEKKWHDCFGMLTVQYRMHEDIAEFPNQFYQNKLECGTGEQSLSIPDYPISPSTKVFPLFNSSRVVFVPTQRDPRSKTNQEEARLVAEIIKYVHTIYGEQFDQTKTIGVITPFRAQIAMIRQELGSAYRDVSVDTVERFQGSEREIIVISYAIKNAKQLNVIQSFNEEGVDRKLNVALTRAKKHLIILGTEETLKKNVIFKSLINHIEAKKGYSLNPLKAIEIPANLF